MLRERREGGTEGGGGEEKEGGSGGEPPPAPPVHPRPPAPGRLGERARESGSLPRNGAAAGRRRRRPIRPFRNTPGHAVALNSVGAARVVGQARGVPAAHWRPHPRSRRRPLWLGPDSSPLSRKKKQNDAPRHRACHAVARLDVGGGPVQQLIKLFVQVFGGAVRCGERRAEGEGGAKKKNGGGGHTIRRRGGGACRRAGSPRQGRPLPPPALAK